MPRNEDGEFELVLGNRQLLSVFFIVVVLLGVFFVMGYIAGRNSAPGVDPSKKELASSPIVVDPSSTKPDAAGKQLAPGQVEVATSNPTKTEPVVEAPKPEPPRAEPPKAEAPPAAKVEEKKPEPKKPEPKKAEPKKPVETKAPAKPEPKPVPIANESPTAPYGQPPKGSTFLQVMAVPRTDAELMVGLLKKKGLPSVIANGPTDGIFRVLVGPCPDAATVSKYREDLVNAGFKGAIIRKY